MTSFRKKNFPFLLFCLFLGFLPILHLIWFQSPILKNDMLHHFYNWFLDFHRNWSWREPFVFWSSSYQMGMPMHAYWQTGYLYPLSWLFFGPIHPKQGIYLFYGFHFFLGIWGMVKLAPFLRLGRFGGLWAGICFGISGFVMARYEQPTFLAGYAWMPWVVWGFWGMIKRQGTRSCLKFVFIVSMQCYGGHPQASFITAILIAIYFFGWLIDSLKKGNLSQTTLLYVFMGSILALAACLPMLFSFLEFLHDCSRSEGLPFAEFTTGSIKPKHLISLILPHFWGTPANGSWWGGELWGEVFVYIGGLGFFFVFFQQRKRWMHIHYLSLLAGIIGIWFAMGPLFGASHILYQIPFANNLHVPARFTILFVFSLSIFSGLGIQNWLRRGMPVKAIYTITIGAILLSAISILLYTHPGFFVQLTEHMKTSGRLDEGKDYLEKILFLFKGISVDAAIIAFVFLLTALCRPFQIKYALVLLLLIDLTRINWEHFYLFPSDYYSDTPSTIEHLDYHTSPFWRISHYVEYDTHEYWQLHNNPHQHWNIFLREKALMTYGIHAIYGLRHESAESPMLWKWDRKLSLADKSVRYFFSNTLPPSQAYLIYKEGNNQVFENYYWSPRIELKKVLPDTSQHTFCQPPFKGYKNLCVHEPRDGHILIQGRFTSGDSLIIREHYFPQWLYRIKGNEWKEPSLTEDNFMVVPFTGETKGVELKYVPSGVYRGLYYALSLFLLSTLIYAIIRFRFTRANRKH
ncbi:MAG: hypothetical protein HQK83_09225 [Fibrobacteria bacterium]|nr:hypothetical protein [Fibrobacteria bacterium]